MVPVTPILISALWCPLAYAQKGYYQRGGHTRLFGSSFATLGANATFDYVIVGGGTGGLAMAQRLAEDPDVSVAIIEAGTFYEQANSNYSQIPAFDVLFSSPEPSDIQPFIDWGITTVPQPQTGNREIAYTAGKCFGGSSARNYLACHRTTKGAFQKWADEVGDDSYEWDAVLPHFKAYGNFTPPIDAKRNLVSEVSYDPDAFSPSGGPLHVSYSNYVAPMTPYIRQAFEALGLRETRGPNSGDLLGYSEMTLSVDPNAETRSSSEASFLQEALSTPRQNDFQIYEQTLARQILFDGNKSASGVKVTTQIAFSKEVDYVISARKEVILSSGVFRSPQLLMVSGIGPRSTLEQYKIPVIADLPGVGQNWQDHLLYGPTYQVNVTTESQLQVNPAFAAAAVKFYLSNQMGPLTNGGNNDIAWTKFPASYRQNLSSSTLDILSTFPSDWPDLELLPIPASSFVGQNDTNNYIAFSTGLASFTSRGNLTINSTDTHDNPVFTSNYLATKEDQELVVASFRLARDLAEMAKLPGSQEFSPGADVQSYEGILEYVGETLQPFHHASCTCKMGRSNDSMAVVDSHGHVFGVSGLRIVDASVFPFLPPGHTQATVYMLAEKFSDEIKKGLGSGDY